MKEIIKSIWVSLFLKTFRKKKATVWAHSVDSLWAARGWSSRRKKKLFSNFIYSGWLIPNLSKATSHLSCLSEYRYNAPMIWSFQCCSHDNIWNCLGQCKKTHHGNFKQKEPEYYDQFSSKNEGLIFLNVETVRLFRGKEE